MGKNLDTNELIFRWDADEKALMVIHSDKEQFAEPIARIDEAILDKMSWPDASKFIGDFVTLLIPDLRRKFESEFAK